MGFKKATKKYILSDSSVNEYGFRLLTSGYQLASFAKNPIGYYMHLRDGGVCLKWEDLAIEGDNVVGVPVINLSNPRGAQLSEEIENGFLNAASVGHIVVLEYSTDPELMLPGQTGPTITKWYNKECSMVDIPGNCNALTQLYDGQDNLINLADLTTTDNILTGKNLNNINMEIKLTPEAIAALSLAAGADNNAINLAVTGLAARNNELKLELGKLKADAVKKDVEAQLLKAMDEKRITAEFRTVLAAQYEKNPEGLKSVLAAMPAFASVTGRINTQSREQGGDYTQEVRSLMAIGWNHLDKTGRLKDLKALSEEAYTALYEQRFGYKPNEKPAPKK